MLASCATAGRAEDKPGVIYYHGESRMTTPDGKPIRTSLSLVKRVLSRADSRIEEHVLTIDSPEAKAFIVVMAVNGTKFSVTERSNAFTGEGELVGEACDILYRKLDPAEKK